MSAGGATDAVCRGPKVLRALASSGQESHCEHRKVRGSNFMLNRRGKEVLRDFSTGAVAMEAREALKGVALIPFDLGQQNSFLVWVSLLPGVRCGWFVENCSRVVFDIKAIPHCVERKMSRTEQTRLRVFVEITKAQRRGHQESLCSLRVGLTKLVLYRCHREARDCKRAGRNSYPPVGAGRCVTAALSGQTKQKLKEETAQPTRIVLFACVRSFERGIPVTFVLHGFSGDYDATNPLQVRLLSMHARRSLLLYIVAVLFQRLLTNSSRFWILSRGS